MLLPAIINCPIGERVVFLAGPLMELFPPMYVIRKGNKKTRLTREYSAMSETTIVATRSHISSFPCPARLLCHDAVTTVAHNLLVTRSTIAVATTTRAAKETG